MPAAIRTIGPLHLEDLEPHRFEDLENGQIVVRDVRFPTNTFLHSAQTANAKWRLFSIPVVRAVRREPQFRDRRRRLTVQMNRCDCPDRYRRQSRSSLSRRELKRGKACL